MFSEKDFETSCSIVSLRLSESILNNYQKTKFKDKQFDNFIYSLILGQNHYEYNRIKNNRFPVKKTIKTIIVIAALLIVLSITAYCFREELIHLFISDSGNDVSISAQHKYEQNKQVYNKWKFDYLPKGFSMTNYYNGKDQITYTFSDSNSSKMFWVTIADDQTGITSGSNEYSKTKEDVTINKIDGKAWKNGDGWDLLYSDSEYIYYIRGDIQKNEELKIAQSIQK